MIVALLLSGLISSQSPVADRPPRPIIQIRDGAVAVFGAALNQQWATASEQLTTLNSAMKLVPFGEMKHDIVGQLRGRMLALRRAVRDHRVVAAATDANWIARLAEEIAAEYETKLPPDVRLLGFFGRALEIDASANDRPKAHTDAADLRTVWGRVEPWVLQRNGTAAARDFNDALVRVDAAVRTGDLASAARAEIAAAQRVAAAYAAPASQAR